MNPQIYITLRVKASLFQNLLQKLFHYENLKAPIYVDKSLFGSSLLVSEQTLKDLKAYYDKSYFVNSIKQLPLQLDIETYKKYKQNKKKEGFNVGDLVRLVLDGNTYVIESLDLKKNTAIISSKGDSKNQISLRVPLQHITVID
jgi:hypothetical protein